MVHSTLTAQTCVSPGGSVQTRVRAEAMNGRIRRRNGREFGGCLSTTKRTNICIARGSTRAGEQELVRHAVSINVQDPSWCLYVAAALHTATGQHFTDIDRGAYHLSSSPLNTGVNALLLGVLKGANYYTPCIQQNPIHRIPFTWTLAWKKQRAKRSFLYTVGLLVTLSLLLSSL